MRKLKPIMILMMCFLLPGMMSSSALAWTTEAAIIVSWDDADDQDGIRPATLDTVLLRDGKEFTTFTLHDANGWKIVFEDIPEIDYEGNSYTYTFKVIDLPGYTAETGTTDEGYFTITYTHEPVMYDIAVTKVWDDMENAAGLRPASVNVQLLKNGAAAGELTLDESNDWTGVWETQPKCAAGKEIAYTVVETAVPEGYSTHVTGSAEDGFAITNEYVPDSALPDTGDDSGIAMWIALLGVSLGALSMLGMKKRRAG